MMKLKLMAALVMGTTLVACGGSSGGGGGSTSSSSTSGSSSSVCNNPFGCDVVDSESELDITNQELPYTDTFSHNSFVENANNAALFFSTGYKALNTQYPQTFEDGTTLDDPEPFFNYPTAGFWEVVDGERTGNLNPDLDYQIYVGNGYLALSNARFTIGQTLTDLVTAQDSEANDAKNRTTGLSVGNVSWGEFDLSQPYRISFCLKDSGATTGGTGGNLEVWVDNNAGGQQDQSMHGAESMLLRQAAPGLLASAGNRLVVDVPGNVRFVDANGATVGNNLDSKSVVIGTETSFLQLRVSSGGYAVISDFMVEHQSNLSSSYPTCTAETGLYEQAPPPSAQGVAFDGLPLMVDLNQSKDAMFALDDEDGFLAIPGSLNTPFYTLTGSASRTWVAGDGTIRFGNAMWTMGWNGGLSNAEQTSGVINLSVPYSISFDIVTLPAAAGEFQIQIDNNSGTGANSVHGTASRILNLTAGGGLTTGTMVVNVPGDVTIDGVVVATVANHIGTPASHISFRCPGNCGNAEEASGGVVLSNIEVDYQGEAPSSSSSASSESSSSSSAPSLPEAPEAGVNYTWSSFPVADYATILVDAAASNTPVITTETPHEIAGLLFLRNQADNESLRHRVTAAEFNFNGTSFADGNDILAPANGEQSPELRSYIGVPVTAGAEVDITVVHRNSSGTAGTGKIVFVGSDNSVLGSFDAVPNSATTTTLELAAGHAQTHVKIFYSREGATGGGMHFTSIDRAYAN